MSRIYTNICLNTPKMIEKKNEKKNCDIRIPNLVTRIKKKKKETDQ